MKSPAQSNFCKSTDSKADTILYSYGFFALLVLVLIGSSIVIKLLSLPPTYSDFSQDTRNAVEEIFNTAVEKYGVGVVEIHILETAKDEHGKNVSRGTFGFEGIQCELTVKFSSQKRVLVEQCFISNNIQEGGARIFYFISQTVLADSKSIP